MNSVCRCLSLFTLGLLGLAACSSDSDSSGPPSSQDAGPDGQSLDAQSEDSSVQDGAEDSSVQDGPIDSPIFDSPLVESDGGFSIRTPQHHSMQCPNAASPSGGMVTTDLTDMDWLCSFKYGGVEGTVYIQATPSKCEYGYGPIPLEYEYPVAQILVSGQLYALQDPNYSWGGNHHNDSLSFTYNGTRYKYFHSSFSVGWRKCQDMDCLQVTAPGASSVTEDGCTPARTIPIVCVPIHEDGSHDELVDTFTPCPTDSNFRDQ